MNLLEVDGKALLSTYGIKVPDGALWPRLPSVDGELVIKAQVPAGKRGKTGGIRFARDAEEARRAVNAMLGETVGGCRVESVYLEEKLDIQREIYLALAVDRDRRAHLLIASPNGGVDIEDVDDSEILKLPIDPLLGIHRFHGARAARFLGGDDTLQQALVDTVDALYRLALAEDAELVEINPLAIVGNEPVAADAKLVLDDNARFRQGAGRQSAQRRTESPLEARVAESGAVGIEIDPGGDVVAIVSGAGLMMATLDLLAGADLKVRAVIDLGGTVLSGGEGLRRVLSAIAPTAPRITFINAFMQTAFCDVFADSLAAAYDAQPTAGRIVVRLKGRRAEAGREQLKPRGFEVHEDLRPAIEALMTSPGS